MRPVFTRRAHEPASEGDPQGRSDERTATRLGVVLRVGLLVTLLIGAPAHAESINKIVATIDGEPVTLYQVKQFVQRDIRGRQVSQSASQSAVLDALITEKIVQKEVSEKGIIVRDEEIDRYIDGIKERNKINDEQLKQALQAQGLTLEQYRTQVREDLQRQRLIGREIAGKVSITPEEIQRYYDAHISEYSRPGRVQVAHILFRLEPDAPPDRVAATTAKADEVYARIKKGADFAEMAKQYSEDPTGQNGGDLGWFKQGVLLDSMEKAALELKVGEVSPPVRTKVGLHIIKLEGREGESHQNLEELSDQIKQQLLSAALEERFQKWVSEDLRKRHHVEMLQ